MSEPSPPSCWRSSSGPVLASFAGALVSAKVGTVFTNSFDVLVSIIILVVVIVGGMGSIPGVLVGALVMIGVLGGPAPRACSPSSPSTSS